MAKLSAETKVGLLVIVGSVILLYMTFAVGKYQFGEKKGYEVTALFDSVSGLDVKAAVRMAGVQIGTVEGVELEDGKAKLTLRIMPGVRIPRGAEAAVKTMGLLGDKYVDIVPPRRLAEYGQSQPRETGQYQNGDRLERTAPSTDADQLISKLSAISDDIKQVTGSLRQVLGTEQGARSMEDILNDLRQTMANLKDFSRTLQVDGSELVMRLNELAVNLNGVVDDNRDNLKVTMANVREASKSAELALASIENAAKKIDQGQGTLGKLVNDESMYNSVDTAAKGLSDYVGRIERMKTIIGFRTQYMFPNSQSYATLELKPREDTYYILEITSDPFGKYTRTETTSTPPGGTVVSEQYEDKFKFSIEFAKRWGNLALRLGLIESTGGIAADYYALNDRLKFSVDSWNYNSKEPNNENAHVKAAASFDVTKNLYVHGGYDNILNSKRATPFAGLGLRFDDEDLKYLLGSVPIPK